MEPAAVTTPPTHVANVSHRSGCSISLHLAACCLPRTTASSSVVDFARFARTPRAMFGDDVWQWREVVGRELKLGASVQA